MTIFFDTMINALGKYRALLKRYYAPEEKDQKLQQFNLEGRPTDYTEVMLFHIAEQVIEDLASILTDLPSSYYSYSGWQNFHEYLQHFLADYMVEDNQVVHKRQKAACAILKAVQYLSLPNQKLTTDVASALEQCQHIIVRWGSKDQRQSYLNVLKKQSIRQELFFDPMITHFHTQLQQYTENEDAPASF